MFEDRLQAVADRVQSSLNAVFAGMDDLPLVRAMSYASEGGKRLRAFLVMESASLHGVDDGCAVWPAMGIEAMHAFSLVHDDLPCMDDDDLRRGRPTVHKAWDEATAVLAGDALQALAFELCGHPDIGLAEVRSDLMRSLARASGARGMVLGQALDMAAETALQPLSLDDIIRLQNGKTGALIQWSAEAGARMAQTDISPMTQYAAAVGLAFQIADDILDVEGDAAQMGKAVGKDADAGKATFVSLLGMDGAKQRAESLVTDACDALSSYGSDADNLRALARFVISRKT